MIKIIVASKNPVKIEAALKGFQEMFADMQFKAEGVSVDSGVSDNPMSHKEARQGAINRAKNAKEAHPDADYWVGLEGGNEDTEFGMEAFGWVAVYSKDQFGLAHTGAYHLPKQISDLIHQGYELGEADDIVFKKKNSKQKMGAIGIMTHGVIDRVEGFKTGVILALVPFINPEHY